MILISITDVIYRHALDVHIKYMKFIRRALCVVYHVN